MLAEKTDGLKGQTEIGEISSSLITLLVDLQY